MTNHRRAISTTTLIAIPAIAAMAFIASAPTARAATAVNPMTVSATVTATCTAAITTLPFPAYTGAVDDANATITVTCTNTTPYNIGLDAGLGAGATVAARSMTLGGAGLNYTLSQDAAYTVNFGNTVGTDTEALVGTGAAQPILIYGQIQAGQLIAPGDYVDTITATVTY